MNAAEPTDRPPVAIDLFCGAGGMSLGFEAAGFETFIAVDNNPIHAATYERNFPATRVLCDDISKVSAEELITATKQQWVERHPNFPWSEDIDCIFGGPSCQGFSEIGRRDPADQRNDLIISFAKLVVDIMPKYFVIENVPGLLSPANDAVLRAVLKTFNDARYALTADGPFILNAADFGVPQARRRVFIVGSRAGVTSVQKPVGNMPKVTVADAIDDLRYLERYDRLTTTDSIRLSAWATMKLERKTSLYARQLRSGTDSRHGGYGLGYQRPWDRTIFASCGRTVHRREIVERFRETPEGSEERISRLPRLRSDGLSPTLRAGTGRDHGSFTSARPIHYAYPRVITAREAARLHSFPDWFSFHVTKWHAFQQVGNAVPPLLATALASSVINAGGSNPEKRPECFPVGGEELLRLSLVEAANYYGVDENDLPKESRRRVRRGEEE